MEPEVSPNQTKTEVGERFQEYFLVGLGWGICTTVWNIFFQGRLKN